ncbi:MAG: RNA polymerase subunit sigma-70 [Bacteroidales bacterium 45-6]|nr:MAG: RNA polymerase subunit sigma-70 [Bacteroidales bacterium 45-6]
MQADDKSIYHLLKEYNSRGMELLFTKYYRPLVLWADTFLDDIPASEDLVQEFFVTFWENRNYEKMESSNIRAYVYTAIKNQALSLLRKRDPLREAVHVAYLAPESYSSMFEEYAIDDFTEEMLQAIENEIEKLPPRMREVLKSVHIQGLSYKETSEKLDISISTVKTLLVKAMKRLRDFFSQFF